jgi:hypothetical protein
MKRVCACVVVGAVAVMTLVSTEQAMASSGSSSRPCVSAVHNIPARRFGRHGITAMQRERFLVKKHSCRAANAR